MRPLRESYRFAPVVKHFHPWRQRRKGLDARRVSAAHSSRPRALRPHVDSLAS